MTTTPKSIATTANGNAYIAGWFKSYKLRLGSLELYNPKSTNRSYPCGFIAKIDAGVTSVKNIPSYPFIVYLNPSNDYFHVALPNELNYATISIFELNGRALLSTTLHASGGVEESIALLPGIYVIVLRTDSTIHKTKWIKP